MMKNYEWKFLPHSLTKLLPMPTGKCAFYVIVVVLRYHGRWILPKNAKNIFFAFRIEKT